MSVFWSYLIQIGLNPSQWSNSCWWRKPKQQKKQIWKREERDNVHCQRLVLTNLPSFCQWNFHVRIFSQNSLNILFFNRYEVKVESSYKGCYISNTLQLIKKTFWQFSITAFLTNKIERPNIIWSPLIKLIDINIMANILLFEFGLEQTQAYKTNL